MKRILLLALVLISFTGFSQVKDWSTFYERSGKKETPRYKETAEYCRRLAGASSWVHFVSFGKTARGRDLPLLIVDKQGMTDPALIRKSGKMVLLVQACIHPGECEGKDAGGKLGLRSEASRSVSLA